MNASELQCRDGLKRCYASWADARRAADRSATFGLSLEPYTCRYCAFIHLTKTRAERAKRTATAAAVSGPATATATSRRHGQRRAKWSRDRRKETPGERKRREREEALE